MAEARDIAVNREFVVSGFLSGQAFRLAVRVDNAATRLIRVGLRDFDRARALETELVSALDDLERTAKDVRKMVDKVNRRRREGVPTSGVKQTYMVRSLSSAHAFRCAVAIDQIQRDISMLGLAASNEVAKTANAAQAMITEAIMLADSIVQSVLKKTENRRPAQRKNAPASTTKGQKPQAKAEQPKKPDEKTKTEQSKKVEGITKADKPAAAKKPKNEAKPEVPANAKKDTAEMKAEKPAPAQSPESEVTAGKPAKASTAS